ncbi:MAG: hypothetical protein IIX78_00230 [Alistipes sp.]|nr:hypothetical protein [Alistipes sp.]
MNGFLGGKMVKIPSFVFSALSFCMAAENRLARNPEKKGEKGAFFLAFNS